MISHKEQWLEAWHVNPSTNRDYDLIDGLRGIAILMVVFGHLVYNINPNAGPVVQFVSALFGAGGYGVVLFFTLSGFLISWPFWRRKVKGAAQLVPPGYGWRRFWKIYPPLALTVIGLTPVYLLLTHDPTFIRTACQWLLGLPLIKPVKGDFNPVMWSLIIEMHFYIVLPLLFLAASRVSLRICLWLIPGLLLLVPVIWRWISLANGVYFTLHPDINVRFPTMLDNFAFGVLLAGFENAGRLKKTSARLGHAGFVLLVLGCLTLPCLVLYTHCSDQARFEIVGGIVKVASALLLCYVADPGLLVSRWLSIPTLRWFGLVSYEWYLVHQPMFYATRTWLGSAQGSMVKFLVMSAGMLFASLLLGAVIYRYFSLPILRFGRARNASVPAPPSGIQPASEVQRALGQ